MKRIALSLATIAAVLTMSFAATGAYFSDTARVSGNTFSTGTVKIDSMASQHILATNLAPGVWSPEYNVDVPYIGTLNANLFVGVTGTLPTTDTNYFANHMTVRITDRNTNAVLYYGLAQNLSTAWAQIATNMTPSSWHYFSAAFYVEPDFEGQGLMNTDTVFLLRAVQIGAPAPTGNPYEFTGGHS